MRVQTVTGTDILPHLDALAHLRITVFREFPYLYDGDPFYEKKYLRVYTDCPESCIVLAWNGQQIIGASTGLPLADSDPDFQQAFSGSGLALTDIFYFGESVLLPDYRGHGIGHAFFDQREAHARELGFKITAFCAVHRAEEDPRRPPNFRSLHPFWKKRGYIHHPEITASFPWKEIDQEEEIVNSLSFWIK